MEIYLKSLNNSYHLLNYGTIHKEVIFFMENIDNQEVVISNKMIRKEFNHVGNAFLFCTFLQMYIPILLMIFIGIIFYKPALSEEFLLEFELLVMVIALVLSESIPFIICSRRLNIKPKEFFNKPTISFKNILLLSVATIGLSVFVSQIVNIIQLLLDNVGIIMSTPDFALDNSLWNNILMLILTIVVAPIFEEFMLRGVALKALSKYGTSFAIIVTALIFALLHGNFIQGIPTFFMGIMFGVITVKSKSIIPAIIIHFINNSLSMSEEYLGAYFPYYGLIITVLFLIGALILIIKYRHLIKMPKDILNHPSAWKCFFTSYSFIIFIIIYLALFIFSLVLIQSYPIL